MTQKHKILISDKLRDVLQEFESESLIARLLLSKEEGEFVEDPINYLSVSEQDMTKISYLSTDRSDKIKKTFNDNITDVQTHLWHSPVRFHARPGSFITKLFKNIQPREVEKFSNLYRANVNKPKFKFKVVDGMDIKKYYHYTTYGGEGRGTLGNSCMKHDGCQRFLDMYVDNRDVVKMLIMLDDNDLLIGRSLLWTYESYKIMDRIYTTCDEELAFYFKKWASDNGYLYKSEQNWFNTMFFESLSNKKQELQIDIKLKNLDYQYYPYVDTFKWFNMETGTIHNYIPKVENTKYLKTLAASNGDKFDWDYIVLDELEKVFCYRNECAFLKYLNIWTHQRNMNFSEINNAWILCKDAFYDESISDYIFNEENNQHNNLPAIEERRNLIKERRERQRLEDEKRMKMNAQRQESLLANIGDLSNTQGYEDIVSMVNEIGIDGVVERLSGQIFSRSRARVRARTEVTEQPTQTESIEPGEDRIETINESVESVDTNEPAVDYRHTFFDIL